MPYIGDDRRSGASASLSILNTLPGAATGSGPALLRTGGRIRVDLSARRVDILVDTEELERRRESATFSVSQSQTPWQEIYRQFVGWLSTGGCLESTTPYLNVIETRDNPRYSH